MQITDKNDRDTIILAMLFADSRKSDNNRLDIELQIAYLRAKKYWNSFCKIS